METYKFSARVTLYASRAVMVLMLILMVCFPMLVELYHRMYRGLYTSERVAILAAFYVSGLAVLPALWNVDRLMRNILKEVLFTMENVNHIRAIRWCCLAVSLVCICAAFGFPSLLFIATIMGFLCLVVTVVGQVMKAAVEIREENDLTI